MEKNILPHAVINGNISIESIFNDIKPIFKKNKQGILKMKGFYLSKDKKEILVDSLSIEKAKTLAFYTLINQRDDGIVIRISPMTDIEKTDGVKSLLGEIAKYILENHVNVKLGKTNIESYL